MRSTWKSKSLVHSAESKSMVIAIHKENNIDLSKNSLLRKQSGLSGSLGPWGDIR